MIPFIKLTIYNNYIFKQNINILNWFYILILLTIILKNYKLYLIL